MGSQGGPPASGRTAVRRDVVVAAQPDVVWPLVSDVPGMGRFSPEDRGGRWAAGAAVDPAAVERAHVGRQGG